MLIRMKSGDNHYVIGQSDINAVKNAGGLPVLIPVMSSTEDIPEQVENIDALYIPGGPDINTLLFGEEPIIVRLRQRICPYSAYAAGSRS